MIETAREIAILPGDGNFPMIGAAKIRIVEGVEAAMTMVAVGTGTMTRAVAVGGTGTMTRAVAVGGTGTTTRAVAVGTGTTTRAVAVGTGTTTRAAVAVGTGTMAMGAVAADASRIKEVRNPPPRRIY